MGFIKNPVKKIVRGIKKTVKSITSFVGDAFGFLIKPFGAMEQPDLSPEAQAQGVKITKSGTNVSIPIVYGFRRVGGTVIHVETNGASNQYLYVVYAICEGEIAGVHRIRLDDNELLPHADTSNVYTAGQNYASTTGRYSGRVEFQIFNGTEDQAQSTLANGSPNWANGNRRLPGIAYAAFRFEWKNSTQTDVDSNPFNGGVPQIQFDVFGKKVFDVSSVTPGSENLPSDYDQLSKSYVQTDINRPGTNPACILLDYLMNTRFGMGIKKEEIHTESFRIAANKYNQLVDLDEDGNFTEFVLTCNTVINSENKLIDNVKILVGGCRGIMPFVSGRYKLKVEDGGNATDITSATIDVAFDVSNFFITGSISLGGESKVTKYNNVYVNYIDPDLEFTSQQVVYSAEGDQAVDDDEELSGEFTFETITNIYQAKELARMIYLKSRNQRTISFTGTQELVDVEPGDIIRITEDILDLNLRTFRVVDMKLDNRGLISIEAIEHTANHYPHVQGEQIEIPPPIFLPDEYSGRPLQRPVSNPPKGIKPPYPTPEDSGGLVLLQPPPPSEYEPIKKPKISAFYGFDLTLISNPSIPRSWNGRLYQHNNAESIPTSCLVRRVDAGTDVLENGYVTQLYRQGVPQTSVIIIDQGSLVRYPCYVAELALALPQEPGINALRMEYHMGEFPMTTNFAGTHGNFARIYNTITTQNTPAGTVYSRTMDNSNYVRIPLVKGLSVKFRAVKTNAGPEDEYAIGGDFSGTNFLSQQYIFKGSKIQDDGLEGFINYLQNTYGYDAGGQQNLGG